MSVDDKVKHIVADILGIDFEKISNDTQLETVCKDSLDLVSIVMDVEDQFDIEIPEEHIVIFKTVKDVINYVREFK